MKDCSSKCRPPPTPQPAPDDSVPGSPPPAPDDSVPGSSLLLTCTSPKSCRGEAAVREGVSRWLLGRGACRSAPSCGLRDSGGVGSCCPGRSSWQAWSTLFTAAFPRPVALGWCWALQAGSVLRVGVRPPLRAAVAVVSSAPSFCLGISAHLSLAFWGRLCQQP